MMPKMKKEYLRYFICVLVALCLAGILLAKCAHAAEVTLSWDANAKTPDGYRIFMRVDGAKYNYALPAWPTDGQNHTQTTCVIKGLQEGKTYYFVARAFVKSAQSGDSNEVTYAVPITPPDAPSNLKTLMEQALANQDLMLAKLDSIESKVTEEENPPPLPSVSGYCANPKSKIFHRADKWCGIGAIPYATREEAISAGYRPCNICKP